MKYTKKDLGSYNLHMIHTDKFRTITVKVLFRRKVIKEEITIRNILTSLLVQSTKKYNSKRKLIIKAQDLYSAGLSVSNTRTGNYTNTEFSLNTLNDKYTEPGNFRKSLELLSEMIFNPEVENGKFSSEKLDIVISKARTNLTSLKENSSHYSIIRSLEAFDKNSPAAFRMDGYIEDLDNINEENLYEYYLDMIHKDLVDIFIIGNFDEEEVINDIRSSFKLRILKKVKVPYRLEERKAKGRRLFAKETIDNTQSKLSIVCTYSGLNEYEINYVLPIYNVIFGGGSDSKLFKEVREKHSLCYTIHSNPKKFDNLLMIQTGIDKENYTKTLQLIEKILVEMRKGKFETSDIDIAKEYYETAYDEAEEDPNALIDIYLMMDFLGSDDLDTKREKMKGVTKSEIIKVAKKIKMDTVFILEGEKDEKARV